MKYAIASFAFIFVVAVVWLNVFATVGSGSYKDSPDGRYRAITGDYLGRDLNGKYQFVIIEIVENATNTTIWNIKRNMNEGETPTDFRHNNLTQWAVDSKSVSVTVTSSEVVVIPLP
jgi:hypothetical protein